MQVVIATTNPGKYRELREGLAPLGWETRPLADFSVTMPEETGATFEDNALMKAAFVAQKTGLPALADDSGLMVDALGGEPGVYSARYGGRSSDRERNVYLLERLRGVPLQERTARFVAVLTLAYPDGHVESYRGEVEGLILEAPRGENGFGYDPLFYLPELKMTFAEMPPEEKARHSHRARALEKLLQAWKNGPPPREIWPLE
ncbi:XTP/dITP diphosphatase [Oceanithermus sp.]